jgi:hypothetical protein
MDLMQSYLLELAQAQRVGFHHHQRARCGTSENGIYHQMDWMMCPSL